MSHELEAAAVDAGGGMLRFMRRKTHVRPPGSPCANCGIVLLGPWCHDCGQLGEDFHRSTPHLVAESIEGLLHFDSRIWRTLPDLLLNPGRLTRNYLEGHRAPQIPPLRLFLVVLLIVFFTGGVGLQSPGKAELDPKVKAGLQTKVIPKISVNIGEKRDEARSGWLRQRISRAVDRPEEFKLILESWSERFAFLMLPLAAAVLSILFIFQRRFYLYDHLIFSMHSLSFQGVLVSLVMLLGKLGDGAAVLLVLAPIHLFAHMRGVYKTSIVGALVRMTLLWLFSVLGFACLMAGLVFVGLSSLAS